MTKPVRVRYAPSPTGFPHVGNIRTALFNWLFARHSGGKFIVRIEDTDVARTVPGALQSILDGLRWLGLDWDEGPDKDGGYGPYFQSQRLHLYKEAAERLIAQDNAYYCYCSTQRLEQMRADQAARKVAPGYDRMCREFTSEDCRQREAQGIKPVVRFKVPLTGRTEFTDLIRGKVEFDNSTIDDFVLLKSDGYPTYHLANVVDDHAMEISHVLRADEWVSSTPRHMLMYKAFGYEPPVFAHMPIILGADRSKLSKRHGAVSITDYRDQGFLPEGMFNFLALLGWSLDDKTEVMSRDDLVKNFSLVRVTPTAAIFNLEKLSWMNGVYMRKLTPEQFFEAVQPFLMKDGNAAAALEQNPDYVKSTLPLVQDRARTLADVIDLTAFFFAEPEYEANLLIEKGMDAAGTMRALETARDKIKDAEFDAATLENILRPLAPELGLKTGQLFGAIRTAVTGRTATPPLFQTMAVLGKERCLKRIQMALDKLAKQT